MIRTIEKGEVIALLCDHAGNMWVGTGGSGLYRFREQDLNAYLFDHRNGLPEDQVNFLGDPDTEQLQATYITDWETEYIQEVEGGRLIVAGNENGAGRVRILDALSLQENAASDLLEEVRAKSDQIMEEFLLKNISIFYMQLEK